MNKHLYLVFLFPFIFSACNLINPKEQTPTYLHLEPFIFTNVDSGYTGSASHNIPSAKVVVDDQTVGIYDLPCTIPVILTKDARLTITPQVINQGLKSYVFSYPFYQSDSTTLYFRPGQVQNFTPKTKYASILSSNSFRLKINFEEGLLFKNLSGDTSFVLEKDRTKVIEGDNSGALYLNQTHKSSESISTNYFEFPANDCFLEFDYNCSIPFAIGLLAENTSGTRIQEYLAGFYPKTTNNKLYVNLTTFKSTYSNFTKFYIIVRGDLNDNDGKYKEGYVLIDNIKVISR